MIFGQASADLHLIHLNPTWEVDIHSADQEIPLFTGTQRLNAEPTRVRAYPKSAKFTS